MSSMIRRGTCGQMVQISRIVVIPQRLLTQIERILKINELRTVTKEVVEAARENLVIGLT